MSHKRHKITEETRQKMKLAAKRRWCERYRKEYAANMERVRNAAPIQFGE